MCLWCAGAVELRDRPVGPYLTQSCSWQKQGYEYLHNLYNIIALLGQVRFVIHHRDKKTSLAHIPYTTHSEGASSASWRGTDDGQMCT